MAKVLIKAGAELDVPTRDEVRADIHSAWTDYFDQVERERARGVKWMRMPVMQGTAANNAISLDEHTTGVALGPEQGFAWSLRRVVIDGMTTGATPDVMNMYRNSITGQPPLWQFNGNSFGYTFGRLELVLLGGDTLKFANVGTFAATGLIRVTGELVEVPAEMLAKLA